jgi:hypothetical protein
MKKLLFFLLFPVFCFGQNYNDNSPKKTTNKSQKTNSNLLQQSITNTIQNSANQNRRGSEYLKNTFKLAFGSCSHQENDLTIFNNIVDHNPDVFVFFG